MKDIVNITELTNDELETLRVKINIELQGRIARRENELREKIRTDLLEYADFLDTEHLDKWVGEIDTGNLDEEDTKLVHINELVSMFSD